MNDLFDIVINFNIFNLKQIIIVIYMMLAVFIVCYNWLYLSHSLHVTKEHMGLNAPPIIRTTIKFSIFLAMAVFIICFVLLMIEI
jgi:hypothetical protein